MAYGSTLSVHVDPSDVRKQRGAFFTPDELANFITSQTVLARGAHVLEPSCGEAVFALSACRRLRALGCDAAEVAVQVTAYELHEQSAHAAAQVLHAQGFENTIRVGDFLKVAPSPVFDAVVGNPPYIRFQSVDANQRKLQQRVAQNVGVKMSALASTWAPFVLHSCAFLRKGGNLGVILPAELLTVNYAAPIRAFLTRSFADVSLYTFDANIFPEVQEEVVILIAHGYRKGSSRSINWFQCSSLRDMQNKGAVAFVPKDGGKWAAGLASSSSLGVLDSMTKTGRLCKLGAWGSLANGGVTGANSYFTLSSKTLEEFGLRRERDVIALCPPGSKHLRRLTLNDASFLEMERLGMRTWLFCPIEPLSDEAAAYVDLGCKLQIDERYKCKKRKPWWGVPLPPPPDAFMSYMNSYGPNICTNEVGLPYLNSCHGITFFEGHREMGRAYLPIAALNSATMLSAELCGRSYGGGIQKLEPREAAGLLVPSPESLYNLQDRLDSIMPDVSNALETRDFATAVATVDKVLSSESSFFSNDECGEIAAECERLRIRRRTRARGE